MAVISGFAGNQPERYRKKRCFLSVRLKSPALFSNTTLQPFEVGERGTHCSPRTLWAKAPFQRCTKYPALIKTGRVRPVRTAGRHPSMLRALPTSLYTLPQPDSARPLYRHSARSTRKWIRTKNVVASSYRSGMEPSKRRTFNEVHGGRGWGKERGEGRRHATGARVNSVQRNYFHVQTTQHSREAKRKTARPTDRLTGTLGGRSLKSILVL